MLTNKVNKVYKPFRLQFIAVCQCSCMQSWPLFNMQAVVDYAARSLIYWTYNVDINLAFSSQHAFELLQSGRSYCHSFTMMEAFHWRVTKDFLKTQNLPFFKNLTTATVHISLLDKINVNSYKQGDTLVQQQVYMFLSCVADERRWSYNSNEFYLMGAQRTSRTSEG